MSGSVKTYQPIKVKFSSPVDCFGFRDRIRILWAAYEFMKTSPHLERRAKDAQQANLGEKRGFHLRRQGEG